MAIAGVPFAAMRGWSSFALCLAALWASPAAAQVTGGSFGGGSFGSPSSSSSSSSWGSSSSGSSSSSWDSSSTSSYGSSTSTSTYGGGASGGLGYLIGLVVGVVFVLGITVYGLRLSRGAVHRGAASHEPLDVSGLSLALDARARKFVQSELKRLAEEGDTATPEGLASLCRETALLLRRCETAWLYGASVNARPAAPDDADRAFRLAAQDARSRYRVEVIRNADGTSRARAGMSLVPRADEGEGVVVVTLLVAARTEVLDVPHVRTSHDAQLLLSEYVALDARTLAVMEVVWAPAVEDDRMSTAELEVLYPELTRLADSAESRGRTFCESCGGPFAAELEACPHCGAPVEA